MASEESSELLAYREKVLGLLREREQRMQQIEEEYSRIRGLLKKNNIHIVARSGSVDKLIAAEKNRRQLQAKNESLKLDIEKVRVEVQQARERLEMVESELLEIQNIQGDDCNG